MQVAAFWDNERVGQLSDDIVKFLSARLDEVERIARVAADARGAEWSGSAVRGGGSYRARVAGSAHVVADIPAHAGSDDPAVATFIAWHDPARALAEVEAKRKIVREYEDARAEWEKWGNGEGTPTARQRRAEALGRLNAWSAALRLAALPYGAGMKRDES